MDDSHVVVDSITPITLENVTYDLPRESGFDSVDNLLSIARPTCANARTPRVRPVTGNAANGHPPIQE